MYGAYTLSTTARVHDQDMALPCAVKHPCVGYRTGNHSTGITTKTTSMFVHDGNNKINHTMQYDPPAAAHSIVVIMNTITTKQSTLHCNNKTLSMVSAHPKLTQWPTGELMCCHKVNSGKDTHAAFAWHTSPNR